MSLGAKDSSMIGHNKENQEVSSTSEEQKIKLVSLELLHLLCKAFMADPRLCYIRFVLRTCNSILFPVRMNRIVRPFAFP